VNARALGLSVLGAIGALALGCGGATTAGARTVSFRIHGGPARATVTIDDRIIGPLDVVAARGVALPSGRHRVSVEADGFLPFDRIVESDGTPIVLDVTLAPVPD
jgi:hypothetical protein